MKSVIVVNNHSKEMLEKNVCVRLFNCQLYHLVEHILSRFIFWRGAFDLTQPDRAMSTAQLRYVMLSKIQYFWQYFPLLK